MVSMIKEGTELMLSCVQGLPSVQGTTIRDVSDPTANQDEQLFCHHVFKFTHIKLGKSPLLGDVDLPVARELEVGPRGPQSHAPCSAAWCGRTL